MAKCISTQISRISTEMLQAIFFSAQHGGITSFLKTSEVAVCHLTFAAHCKLCRKNANSIRIQHIEPIQKSVVRGFRNYFSPLFNIINATENAKALQAFHLMHATHEFQEA